MVRIPTAPTDYGAWLLTASAAAGLALSLFNYFWPANGINHTPGALLVIISTAFVLSVSFAMALNRFKGRWLRVLLGVFVFLCVIGTGVAAYFLEAHLLIALMGLGLAGWLIHAVFGPPGNDAIRARTARSGAAP